jgi:DNA repair protein RecO (recombination protein O)
MLKSHMNYKTYSSEGFVMARKNYGEADRILILFTKDFGKISMIAKGVRKLTSRKRGGIEIFSKIKFSAVKGKSLDILTEIKMIDSYDAIRSDLRRVSVAYYISEVLSKVTRENEKHEEIFSILDEYFHKIEMTRNLKQMRLNFVKDILISIGFWPEGKPMDNPDQVLENVIERKINSSRVGRKMLQQ